MSFAVQEKSAKNTFDNPLPRRIHGNDAITCSINKMIDFQKWFIKPIQVLKKEYGSDGGFIALMASFSLAERLVKAVIKKNNGNEKKDFHSEIVRILEVPKNIESHF